MANPPFLIVAIDGGAASGKSSSARLLADRFDLLHVDTGSFYRHITAELLRRGVPSSDLKALETALAAMQFSTQIEGRSARLLIDAQPAGDEIRSEQVNSHVSHYAAIPEVRHKLLSYQRGLADVARQHRLRGLVMEGRDIGSVIFPDAGCRFFLHADPLERAKRRAAEGRFHQRRAFLGLLRAAKSRLRVTALFPLRTPVRLNGDGFEGLGEAVEAGLVQGVAHGGANKNGIPQGCRR